MVQRPRTGSNQQPFLSATRNWGTLWLIFFPLHPSLRLGFLICRWCPTRSFARQYLKDDGDGDVTVWLTTKRLTDYTCICLGACVFLPRIPWLNMVKVFENCWLPATVRARRDLGRLCACDKFGLLKGVSAWNDVCQLHECPYSNHVRVFGPLHCADLCVDLVLSRVELTAIMQIEEELH